MVMTCTMLSTGVILFNSLVNLGIMSLWKILNVILARIARDHSV